MDPVAGIVACFIAPGLRQRNTLRHSAVSAQAASVGGELGRPAGVRCAVVRPRHTAPAPTPLVEGSAADRVQTRCHRVQMSAAVGRLRIPTATSLCFVFVSQRSVTELLGPWSACADGMLCYITSFPLLDFLFL